MTKISTKTGDGGTTALASGERVSKSDARVETYGTIDELQAQLGMARAFAMSADQDDVAADLKRIEERLFHVMAQVADAPSSNPITEEDVQWLESRTDAYAPERFAFVIPGNSIPSASLHVARTVARRCERQLVRLAQEEPVDPTLLAYLNRLSDLLYCMAVHGGASS